MSRAAGQRPWWACVAVLAMLVWAPLPQGSVPLAYRHALTMLMALCCCLVAGYALLRRSPLPLPVGTGWLIGLLGIGVVQLLPGLTALRSSLAVPAEAGASTISLVPARSGARALELAVLISIGVVAARLFASGRQALVLAWVLLASAAGLSVYGLLVHAGTIAPLHLAEQREPAGVVVATFFNRNNFAGLLEMALLSGVGLAWWTWQRRSAPVLVAVLALLLVTAVALVATHSRAGLVCCGFGLLLLVVLLRRGQRRASPWPALLGAAALLLLSFAALGPDTLTERFADIPDELASAGTRPDIWAAGARLVWHAPMLGTGLGTYGDVSPFTQGSAVPGHVEHAHCDPLQAVVEVGLVGLAMLLVAGAFFWRHAWRGMAATDDPRRRSLAAGLLAGVGALTAHGLVDFNFQIPANALWVAVCAGAAAGLLAPLRRAPSIGWQPLLCPAALLAVNALVVADAAQATRSALVLAADPKPSQAVSCRRALAVHPLTGEPARAACFALLAADNAEQHADEVEALARGAIARNPLSPSAHRALALALLLLEQPGAERAMQRALRCVNPHDRSRFTETAAFAFIRHGRLDVGCRWLRQVMQQRAGRRSELLTQLWLEVPVYDLVRAAVPNEPAAHREFAHVLFLAGELAARELELAAARGEPARVDHFTLADGVWLTGKRLRQHRDSAGQQHVSIALEFDLDTPQTPPVPFLLRCHGSGRVWRRSCSTAEVPFEISFALDRSVPPGDYVVDLLLHPELPAVPLGSIAVAGRALRARADRSYEAATSLYLHTRRDAMSADVHGVALQHGDELWRDLKLPPGASVVRVMVGAGSGVVEASFSGEQLQPTGQPSARMRSFRLPSGDTVGRLRLRAEQAAVVRSFQIECGGA